MSDKIEVSICCLTFNHGSFIRECLDGFLFQKCDFKFEVLVHDDASNDNTQEIILEYQKKHPHVIKPILQDVNQHSRNIGGLNIMYNFPRAQGRYIAICEGDDHWIDPLKLQKQVDFLKSHISFSGAASKSDVFYTKTGIRQAYESHNKELITINDLQKNLYFQTATFIFRTDILKHFIKLPILSGDKYMFLLVSCFGNIKMFPEVTSVYRKHSGGLSHFVTSSQILADLLIADSIRKFSDKFKPNDYKIHILEKVFMASSKIYLKDFLKATYIYFKIVFSNKMEHTNFWYIKHYYRLAEKGLKKVKLK